MTQEQYDRVCKHEFSEINKKLDLLTGNFNGLFKDNGNESIQSKINSNSKTIKLIVGVFSVIGSAIIGLMVWMIKGHL